jgi:large subunit ribosomal protein L22
MPVQATARLRYVSIPPRKMRLVADLIRGLPVEKALNILNFTPRIAAYHLAKTVKSAAANALSLEGTDHLHPEDLFVKTVTVDPGPAAKRIRFQSMGRVFRYRKHHCHVTVVLQERPRKAEAVVTAGKPGEAVKAAPAKKTKAAPKKSTAKKTTKKTSSSKSAKAPAKKSKKTKE